MIRGVNDDEMVDLRPNSPGDTGYDIRFIEYMPLDAEDEWVAEGS